MKSATLLLTVCAALSVVLASPHSFHAARHHAIAARAPAPAPEPEAVAVPEGALPVLNRRQRNCKPRPSNPNNSTVTKPSPPVGNNNPAPIASPAPPKQEQPPVNAAPVPSPSPSPSPTPVQAPPAPPTTPTPTPPSSNLPSFMAGVQSGQATFFDVALGACGFTSTSDQHVVAVSWRLFDNYPGYNKVNPNTNPVCGKKIKATYEGKSVVVTVVDRCADDTCLVGNLDFSRSAFGLIASFDLGRLFGMTWEWVA